jgi:copper oxidase (laccase) domain-containing protein
MIASDQPTIFGNDVVVALSSVEDGNMSFRQDASHDALENRKAFFKKAGISINDATVIQVSYEGVTDFARYTTLTEEHKAEGMLTPGTDLIADALVVTKPGHAIFLPVADCTVAVIYDPRQQVLMVSHLGRQSAEVNGGQKSIDYLHQQFGTNPQDVKVWLGPAVSKSTFPIYALDNKGLHEAILEQLKAAGVSELNIEENLVDTATSPDYFSHSAFLKGDKPVDSRFAVVAAMRMQGEPAS